MILPALAPVPTEIDAESPAAVMLTVAVPAPNTQLTAAWDGARRRQRDEHDEELDQCAHGNHWPLRRGFDSNCLIL